ITVVAVGNAARIAECLNVFNLPYIFEDFNSAVEVFSSDFVQVELNEKLASKHDMRAIGWLIGGFRHMTNSKRPVTTLADIEGLKIRTPKNRLMRDTYEAFGAQVKAIAWGETFDNLKDKVVDGQENPYSVIYDSRFWEANQTFLTNNGPFLWTGPILMSESKLKSLSADHQAAILKAGMEASQFEWRWIEKENNNFMDRLKKNGMQISELSDREEWLKRAKQLWSNNYSLIGYGDEKMGKDIVTKILNSVSQ
ncbi:MAG: TRAP transporter substrate-binding protein, partial [Pseudomonadota bacterium]